MKKLTFQERAIDFAMSEDPERVQAVITTMRVILSKRQPPKERKVRKSTAEPQAAARGGDE